MRTHLRQFLDYLRFNRNLSARTVRAYESDLNQYHLEFLERHLDRPADRIAPADVDYPRCAPFMARAIRPRAGALVGGAAPRRDPLVRPLAAARGARRSRDPGALMATPKQERKLPARLEEREMARMLEAPDVSTPLGRRDRAILELFYASGLRLAELVGPGPRGRRPRQPARAGARQGRQGAHRAVHPAPRRRPPCAPGSPTAAPSRAATTGRPPLPAGGGGRRPSPCS